MIPLQSSPSTQAMPNTVMPTHMAGRITNSTLNLDQKKAQKKADEEKKKKKKYTYLLFTLSITGLAIYSVLFFYPYLMAYLNAPTQLEQMEQEIAERNESILTLQEEKSLHKAAYEEENQRKTASVDVVFPPYSKQGIVRDVENAINTLRRLGTFEMNSITLGPPIPQGSGWTTSVSGNLKASKETFDVFIDDYIGDSGQLEIPSSTIAKELKQISLKPTELEIAQGGASESVEGVNASFKIIFHTRPPEEK